MNLITGIYIVKFYNSNLYQVIVYYNNGTVSYPFAGSAEECQAYVNTSV